MSILHPTQAHRRLRLALQIGCAIVAVKDAVLRVNRSNAFIDLHGVTYFAIFAQNRGAIAAEDMLFGEAPRAS